MLNWLLALVLIPASILSSSIEEELWDNPYIEESLKERILPLLLPQDHPARPMLEQAFSASRASHDTHSFKTAGFVLLTAEPWGRLIGYHPSDPFYVIKAHKDTRPGRPEGLLRRAEIATAMRDFIAKHQLSYILVPQTYVYLLPLEPAPTRLRCKNGFVLVQERLDILSKDLTRRYWAMEETWNLDWIEELYFFFHAFPLSDFHFHNVCLTCALQQVALVDLERVANRPERVLRTVGGSLPGKWRAYWFALHSSNSRQRW